VQQIGDFFILPLLVPLKLRLLLLVRLPEPLWVPPPVLLLLFWRQVDVVQLLLHLVTTVLSSERKRKKSNQ
jgi:hypothetical protein